MLLGDVPMIDHLILGGPAERWHDGKSLYVMTYDEPKTGDNIARLSDHCAVYATIQPKP